MLLYFFFFNDTATTEIYTLSLHDALPISCAPSAAAGSGRGRRGAPGAPVPARRRGRPRPQPPMPLARRPIAISVSRRSEEHTSELQSRQYLVCRLLLEKKKKNERIYRCHT